MNKEFIPYEQALELKELGFDEPCYAYYEYDTKLVYTSIVSQNTNSFWVLACIISAPLYQQAFRWFREKHGLYGIYTMGDDWNNYYWQVWRNDCMTKTYLCSSDYVYETYEEAEIDCLLKLIEIVKNK